MDKIDRMKELLEELDELRESIKENPEILDDLMREKEAVSADIEMLLRKKADVQKKINLLIGGKKSAGRFAVKLDLFERRHGGNEILEKYYVIKEFSDLGRAEDFFNEAVSYIEFGNKHINP